MLVWGRGRNPSPKQLSECEPCCSCRFEVASVLTLTFIIYIKVYRFLGVGNTGWKEEGARVVGLALHY